MEISCLINILTGRLRKEEASSPLRKRSLETSGDVERKGGGGGKKEKLERDRGGGARYEEQTETKNRNSGGRGGEGRGEKIVRFSLPPAGWADAAEGK